VTISGMQLTYRFALLFIKMLRRRLVSYLHERRRPESPSVLNIYIDEPECPVPELLASQANAAAHARWTVREFQHARQRQFHRGEKHSNNSIPFIHFDPRTSRPKVTRRG